MYASKLIRCVGKIKNLNRYCSTLCNPLPIDPRTNISILNNGVRVATEHQKSPLAAVCLVVEAGSRYETACNNGICHFIEHMAFKGFCNESHCQVEERLHAIGAAITVSTTREMQTFTARCFPEHVPVVIEKLCKIITCLLLDPNIIDLEKYNICLEMLDSDNDPKSTVFDYLHQTAFQGTPLANRVIGPSAIVNEFKSEFAAEFIKEFYQPYKLIVACSGDLNHPQIVQLVETGLGSLNANVANVSDGGPYRYTGSSIVYRDDSLDYAHVAVAFEAPGYLQPGYTTLEVARAMVGEWSQSQGGGLNNAPMLAHYCATENLCEEYKAFYITYGDVGLWGIYFVASKMCLDEMLLGVQYYWMILCNSPETKDVERGVNAARLQFGRSVEGVVRSAQDVGRQVLYSCSRKPPEIISRELSIIKLHNIQEVCSEMMLDREPVVAAVGPTECLPDYIRTRASTYWVRF